MVAAPEDSPIKLSRSPSGSARKSIPASLIKYASSRVVSVASISRIPSSWSSGRIPSYFLAMHGMIETVYTCLGAYPIRSAPYVLAREPFMPIGDLQDEKWESNSGQNVSAYFCHPGQQDVKWGRFFPCVNRSTNSVASSHMVTSAVNSVSPQWANPSCLSAVSILPLVTVPVGSPKASPSAYRTDGAGMAMHLISGSHNFRRNSGIQVCSSKMAPSGQCVRHCPQLMQPSV